MNGDLLVDVPGRDQWRPAADQGSDTDATEPRRCAGRPACGRRLPIDQQPRQQRIDGGDEQAGLLRQRRAGAQDRAEEDVFRLLAGVRAPRASSRA